MESSQVNLYFSPLNICQQVISNLFHNVNDLPRLDTINDINKWFCSPLGLQIRQKEMTIDFLHLVVVFQILWSAFQMDEQRHRNNTRIDGIKFVFISCCKFPYPQIVQYLLPICLIQRSSLKWLKNDHSSQCLLESIIPQITSCDSLETIILWLFLFLWFTSFVSCAT